MEINLFSHNIETYEALKKSLVKNNRVAIIQPPGTGKSMIVLKLLQENKDKKALFITSWKTIINDFKGKINKYNTNGDEFGDIQICNYAYLFNNIGNLPDDIDYIILDEFHHCGAPVTNIKVDQLLDKYPLAKIIGTSATPIRHLDNKRNMSTELFNDNVICDMTLAQAIANKLLPTPIYVTALYSYDEELINYENKILEIDDDNLKTEYDKILVELKRQLATLDGINNIFKKYITNKDGKYIVFCKDQNHLEELVKGIKSKKIDWFNDIDDKPSIYTVSYGQDDANNEDNIDRFTNDKSNHIKLLFSINMANEGLHFEDIDGVIMLRPTASPNLYIQQLGRALSVQNSGKQPLVFDLVSNIQSHNYVYELITEINNEVAANSTNKHNSIVDITSFKVVDNLKKIESLVSKLTAMTLTKWDVVFNLVLRYIDEFGSINDLNTDFEEDYLISNWLNEQEKLFKQGRLTVKKIILLQSVGALQADLQFSKQDLICYNNFCDMVDKINAFGYKSINQGKASEVEFKNFVEGQFYLIKLYIDKYYFRQKNQKSDLDDYIQECLVGLTKGIKEYNTSKGNYKLYIERSIYSQLAKTFYGIADEFADTVSHSQDLIYDQSIHEDDKIISEEQALLEVDQILIADYVKEMLDNSALSVRDRRILELRFGLKNNVVPTLDELGKEFNIHMETVRQREAKALRRFHFRERRHSNIFDLLGEEKPSIKK